MIIDPLFEVYVVAFQRFGAAIVVKPISYNFYKQFHGFFSGQLTWF